MNALILRLVDGTAIAVPSTLDAMTTYILLEQETWFEKETAIVEWFGPGATIVDIGANFGVYSLPLARRVAPGGQVFAYEPASEPRALLEKSRALNRLDNLHVIPAAVSDRPREGRLVFGESSELHRLGTDGAGETVAVTSLDEEARLRDWPTVDFVKIDAEGAEHGVLDGGSTFFARHSPLVMFEFKSGADIDHTIAGRFRTMGYGIFRLLRGAPLLVPVAADETLDRFELNLLAAKPDRAAALARAGRLVETAPPQWQPPESATNALDLLRAQSFAPAFWPLFESAAPAPAYWNVLAAYADWRSETLSPAARYAALLFAYRGILDLCQTGANSARLSTLARIAWELGWNATNLNALNALCRRWQRGPAPLDEVFWPACPRYDAIAPGERTADWFIGGALEQLERSSAYSSAFFDAPSNLDWLAAQPFASPEMERRRLLKRLRRGERVAASARLSVPGPGHINAEVWRDGLVPNSLPQPE